MTETGVGCGDCRLCCRILEVKEIGKPFLKWCAHAVAGVGCAIYHDRPESCRAFECTWLTSQRGQGPNGEAWERMPPELRPDRCGVIFAPVDQSDPDHVLHVHTDPHRPMAWARADVKAWIARIVKRGITIVLSVGEKHTVLRRDLPNMRRIPMRGQK
jgi:uncharacterized protein